MPDQKTEPPVAQSLLICRLRHKPLRRGSSPTAGEVELENSSSSAIEIETDMHPLQYLNIVVTDPRGSVLSEGHYGDIFSPLGRIDTLHLGPGEKYCHNVSLLGTLPQEKRLPGAYTVSAVYKYKGLRVVSEPLQVQLPAMGANGEIPGGA